jgi:hypothetical protein
VSPFSSIALASAKATRLPTRSARPRTSIQPPPARTVFRKLTLISIEE